MGTTCAVIVKISAHRHKVITVNWDGYPEHAGATLLKHYATKPAILKLLKLGHLSTLHASTNKPRNHTFERPVAGHCVAYGRDRGQSNQEADTFITVLKKENSAVFRHMIKLYSRTRNYVYYWAPESGWSVYINSEELPLSTVVKNV